MFYAFLNKAFNKHAPLKTKRVKQHSKPSWLSSDIKDAMYTRDRYHKQKDWENYKKWRNLVTEKIKKAKHEHYKQAIEENQKSSSIWKYLNELNSKAKPVPPSNIKYNDKTATTMQDIVDSFSQYFSSVYDNYQGSNEEYDPSVLDSNIKEKLENSPPLAFDFITEHDVYKTLDFLNVNKATGLDGIGPRILKLSAPIITKSVTHIINISIATNRYPDLLKHAKVTPILKKGARSNPENYNMHLNINKTKCMLLTTAQRLSRMDKKEIDLNINGEKIDNVINHKLLGINIDHYLHWEEQIDLVYKKINSKLALLSKIKWYLTLDTRILYFNAYILPMFDYCVTIWGNCSKQNIQRISKLQKKAARIIFNKPNDAPSKPLFDQLKWLEFEKRIMFQKCILMYKCLNGIAPIYLEEIFTYNEAGYSLRSCTDSKIQLPKPKLEIYKKSFHFSGPEIWNSIPIHIRSSKSLKSFKDKCFSYLLSSQ